MSDSVTEERPPERQRRSAPVVGTTTTRLLATFGAIVTLPTGFMTGYALAYRFLESQPPTAVEVANTLAILATVAAFGSVVLSFFRWPRLTAAAAALSVGLALAATLLVMPYLTGPGGNWLLLGSWAIPAVPLLGATLSALAGAKLGHRRPSRPGTPTWAGPMSFFWNLIAGLGAVAVIFHIEAHIFFWPNGPAVPDALLPVVAVLIVSGVVATLDWRIAGSAVVLAGIVSGFVLFALYSGQPRWLVYFAWFICLLPALTGGWLALLQAPARKQGIEP